jgi:hypothetical protein
MPVTQSSRSLRYALAGLSLAAVVGLGVRLAAQVGALNDARDGADDAARREASLRLGEDASFGEPLLATSPGDGPAAQLAAQLRALGFTVRNAEQGQTTTVGRDRALARLVADGSGDATALDRLSLWAKANARAVILESVAATAAAGGKSDVHIEIDALMRRPREPDT